jgi:hypothetical protein
MKNIYKISLFSIIFLVFLIGISLYLLKSKQASLVESGTEDNIPIEVDTAVFEELEESLNIKLNNQERECLSNIKKNVDEVKNLHSLGREAEALALLKKSRVMQEDGCGLNSLNPEIRETHEIEEAAKERLAFSFLYKDLKDLFLYYNTYSSIGTDEEIADFCKNATTDLFSDKIRAMFYQELAERSLIYPDKFVKEHVFDDYPLTQFYQGDGNMRENNNQLLKMGYEIHELMATDYQLALYYLEEALANKNNQGEYRKYVELFDRFMRKGDYHYYEHEYILEGKSYGKGFEKYIEEVKIEDKTVFMTYLYRAKINDVLNGDPWLATKNPLNNEELEVLFKKIMKLSAEPSIAKSPERYEHFARLYYAIFLQNAFGEERIVEIKALLAPIYQMKGNEEKGIFVFLQKEAVYSNEYPLNKELLNLAKIDPQMKELLFAAGWKNLE